MVGLGWPVVGLGWAVWAGLGKLNLFENGVPAVVWAAGLGWGLGWAGWLEWLG